MATSSAPVMIPTVKEFDPKKLRLSADKKNTNTRISIMINTDDKKPVMFYIPKCRLAHGISAFCETTGSVPTQKDSFSFKIELNEDLEYFAKSWLVIENELKELIAKDSKTLLGKKYDIDDINKMFETKIKKGGIKDEATNERYNSTFSVKQTFNHDTGVSLADYLDGQNKNAKLDITYLNAKTEIPRGTICLMYLKLYKITFSSNKLNIMIFPTQVSVNRPSKINAFAPLPIASDDLVGRDTEGTDKGAANDGESMDMEPNNDFKIDENEVEGEADEDDEADIPNDTMTKASKGKAAAVAPVKAKRGKQTAV